MGRKGLICSSLCQSGLRGLVDGCPTEETTEPKSAREGGGRKVNKYMKGLGVWSHSGLGLTG